MARSIIPITRMTKFFSEKDFQLEVRMGREVIEGDNNFKLVLFRVDLNKTQSSNIYNEAKKDKINFLPPMEINVLPLINKAENKTYNQNNGSLRYLQDGTLSFIIYIAHLVELQTEINYGDYIGYQVDENTLRYFTVVNDGLKNYDNGHTMLGYKPFYRTIVCAPIDANEFSGI